MVTVHPGTSEGMPTFPSAWRDLIRQQTMKITHKGGWKGRGDLGSYGDLFISNKID